MFHEVAGVGRIVGSRSLAKAGLLRIRDGATSPI
jgi:hypothetical protein